MDNLYDLGNLGKNLGNKHILDMVYSGMIWGNLGTLLQDSQKT